MKNKKKIIIGLIVGIILIAVIVLVVLLIINKNKEELLLTNDLTVEVNSEVYLSSFVREDNKLEINNGNTLIDTSHLGEQELTIEYKNKKKIEKYTFKINVVDTTKPVITYDAEITTKVGRKIDLLSNVSVKDNSKEVLEILVVGEYNINKEGEYNLKYTATDSSGNKAEEDFVLKVTNSTIVNRSFNYPKLELPSGEQELIGVTDNGFDIYKINDSIYIDGILIANKTYPLADGYVPSNTYRSAEGVTSQCPTCINKTAYQAWSDMQSDAAILGLNIWIQSGYRPYSLQVVLYNQYVSKDGVAGADTYSSRPGHSEHQTGLSFDLNTITNSFANTEEGKWVNNNAYKYGYIIRFPKGKEEFTGYQYEPWHLRYVGTDLATILYNNGDWMSLEEYFGITSVYAE